MTKTVEETYQKKTPIEHILLRPDTYIGSVEHETQQMYVWSESKSKIVQKSITYVPGLYKIFDEIIVNAADNKIRDPSMNLIKVNIDPELNQISVYNNGRGVPIKMHSEENVYVPELIFGQLLTSSNYDDKEKKVTGGRNGYGAKLCNIFSKEFIVETVDNSVKKKYYQKYNDNMSKKTDPELSRYTKEEFTRITFKPDLERFKMKRLDEDTVSLLKKRVYDLCGTVKNIKVYLNDERINVLGFKQYIQLYLKEGTPIVHQVINDRWEVAFTCSDEQFQQVSFVNSICTSKGGSHVNHVVETIIEPLVEAVKKREKSLDPKPFQIKSCMFLFVSCLIDNAAFDSQTKENLTLRASSFGSRCTPMDSFVKSMIRNTDIVEKIASFAKAKQSMQLKKTDGSKVSRLSGIPKLDDANLAGTKQSPNCTLILTEGDSAKTLAVSGLSVVGRDLYGVFPLRGKLLNVREASHKQIMENAEISAIKKILGLQHNKVYETTDSLRYGHVMIMTDQDHDGSHIKGLIINFFDHFYPSLLKIPGFLQEFITPIIRVTKNKVTKDFFSIPEYEEFMQSETGWTAKYYKGLGTSTSADAKYYFSNLPRHVKSFDPLISEDKDLIDLAFNKKKADFRKTWLLGFEPGTFLDITGSHISISDFVNKELILFSMADNIRSIPSLVDGLKPGQRKVLFSCFKRGDKKEIKVSDLVGYVSQTAAYHHGEMSLCSTIVNLAQDYVGSNNINLLLPLGQFGSRLQGGKDHASARYISTNLSPLTRLIYREHDDALLNYLSDDNRPIEPEFFVPIIPMVLVNGAEGIGTGWSTNIPNYNPVDIIDNIRRLLNDKEIKEMVPFYRNFRGEINKSGDGKYQVSGTYEDDGDIVITELPVGTWTQNYKEYLESLVQSGTIKDFKEYHTEKTVYFRVQVLKNWKPQKLVISLSTSNMVCFDSKLKIKKCNSVEEIIKDFFYTRLQFYTLRKEHILKVINCELVKLKNKVRFIKEVTTDSLVISKRKKIEIVNDLERRGYDKLDNFEYLLSMQIGSLAEERIEKLNEEYNTKKKELDLLLRKTPKNLWEEDLNLFEREYNALMSQEYKEYENEVNNRIHKSSSKRKRSILKKNQACLDMVVKKPKVGGQKSSMSNKTSKASLMLLSKNSKRDSDIPVPKKTKNSAKSNGKKIVEKTGTKTGKSTTMIDSDTEDESRPWEKYIK